MNKHRDLELYVIRENFDVICITETWLNNNILDDEMSIEGYNLFRKDRDSTEKQRGGGVAIYIKNELDSMRVDELNDLNFPESVWCKICCNGEITLLGVCYRVPCNKKVSDEALYKLIDTVSKHNVIIMGDFNFPELDWGKPEEIDPGHPFIECINNNFLTQLVTDPTRGKNYLDLVLSSEEGLVENITVRESLETSDHQMINFELICRTHAQKRKTKNYCYFKANYENIREYATSLTWNKTLLEQTDVNIIWTQLKSDILDIRDKYIPLKKKMKSKCKWATRKVVRLREKKKNAWNLYVSSGRNRQLYKKYMNILTESVKENKKAKRDFEEKLANIIKHDSKSFYAYVRSKQRNKSRAGPFKDHTGSVVTCNTTAANLLNNYFSSVFTKEDLSYIPIPANIFPNPMTDELSDIVIDEEIVREKLSNINTNKSLGADEIHPKLLYELREALLKPLTRLFKLSIELGIVPQDWRDASVTPLHKKGSKEKVENYRPISLTSVIGKLLESVVKETIVNHLETFSLIRNSQHGFRSGRSCLTNLLDFFEKVTEVLDEGNPVDVVYLDFAKAFDKVPYTRLYKKMEAHGIKGKALDWVKSWLYNRRQKVSIDKDCSEWIDVTSGVPQGSVLGPILFMIYINDIDTDLISRIGKFADDTKMCKSVNTMQDVQKLQADLDKLNNWSNEWQMQFNVDKCTVMHFGRENKRCKYSLGNRELKESKEEKDLGVIIDTSMKFSEQCNTAVKNANRTLGLIRRTIKSKSKKVIVKLYKALVRPKVEYCVQAWRPYLKKDVVNIEKIQHRATKMIEECKGMTYNERLAETKLITLDERRTRGDLLEVFKMVKGISKVDYTTFFELAKNNRTRGHAYKLVKLRSRIDIRKNFFSQRVINGWNKLPAWVVEAQTVNSFKNRYDKHCKNISLK